MFAYSCEKMGQVAANRPDESGTSMAKYVAQLFEPLIAEYKLYHALNRNVVPTVV